MFYDYVRDNITIKENIVEMNMTMEQILKYSNFSNHGFYFTRNLNKGTHGKFLRERAESFGNFEHIRSLQKKMRDSYDIEYWMMDLIKT